MTSSGLRQSATLRSCLIIYQRGPPQELILDVSLLILAIFTDILHTFLTSCRNVPSLIKVKLCQQHLWHKIDYQNPAHSSLQSDTM